jgi:hypothetical protein
VDLHFGALAKFNAPHDCTTLAPWHRIIFQINDLTEFCTDVFKTNILRVENAAQLYAHFDDICIIDHLLKQAVLDLLAQKFRECAQTPDFAKLSQSQLLVVIECYHQHQDKQRAQVMILCLGSWSIESTT